jgi:hypothetical protein
MLLLPNHFPVEEHTATPPAAGHIVSASPSSSQPDSAQGSPTLTTTKGARQPAPSRNTGRTRVQPAGVQRAGTRQQLPRRAKSDANALHAPYVPLSSQPEDETDAMEVDDDAKGTSQKRLPSAEISDPTIVRVAVDQLYVT